MVVIAGEPGVGKTRLAHELLVQAAPRGFRGIVGRCFEQYSTVPFLPWSAVLSDGLGIAPPALHGEALERWPEPAPEGGQLRLFQALTTWLKALAIDHPLVVVLEDAQWADSASLGPTTSDPVWKERCWRHFSEAERENAESRDALRPLSVGGNP
jgi:predicted ATPase